MREYNDLEKMYVGFIGLCLCLIVSVILVCGVIFVFTHDIGSYLFFGLTGLYLVLALSYWFGDYIANASWLQ